MTKPTDYIIPHYMDLRIQSDLRAVVAKYIADDWQLVRGDQLELVKGDQRKLAELQDLSGRFGV